MRRTFKRRRSHYHMGGEMINACYFKHSVRTAIEAYATETQQTFDDVRNAVQSGCPLTTSAIRQLMYGE